MTFGSRVFFIGGLYHPPKPIYELDTLTSYLEETLDSISAQPQDSTILLAGDFNRLPSQLLLQMGLHAIFEGPSHEGHPLDRVYCSERLDCQCSATKSSVKTRHSAVLMTTHNRTASTPTYRRVCEMRLRTPDRMSRMQNFLSDFNWSSMYNSQSTQESFDIFYSTILTATDDIFPIKKITIKDRDPPYMTPFLKHLLRKRNRLFRRGHSAAAAAVADRINQSILKSNTVSFVQGL